MSLALYNILLAPHITEKATMVGEKNGQYVFKVHVDANKDTIKQAVEKLFKVKVTGVNIVKRRPRTVRFGRRLGTQKGWKKAYVTLGEGQEIKFDTGA